MATLKDYRKLAMQAVLYITHRFKVNFVTAYSGCSTISYIFYSFFITAPYYTCLIDTTFF